MAAARIFLTKMRATRTELTARALPLALHMQPAPRQVCPAECSDILGRGDGVSRILSFSRNYLAPEAADVIHQLVMLYMRYRRSDKSIDKKPSGV